MKLTSAPLKCLSELLARHLGSYITKPTLELALRLVRVEVTT